MLVLAINLQDLNLPSTYRPHLPASRQSPHQKFVNTLVVCHSSYPTSSAKAPPPVFGRGWPSTELLTSTGQVLVYQNRCQPGDNVNQQNRTVTKRSFTLPDSPISVDEHSHLFVFPAKHPGSFCLFGMEFIVTKD